MKKQKLFIVASLILVGICLTSCFKTNDDTKYDKLELDERVYLFEVNDTTMPYAKVDIEFNYPVKFKRKEDLQRLQQIFKGTFFNNQSYDALSPKDALHTYLESYTEEYRELGNQYYEDMGNLEGDDRPSWYWYQMQKSNEILFEDDNVLSYSVQHSEYTGGAHGSLQMLYYIIDLDKLTTITEEDIFAPNYHQLLTSIIIDRLMEKYKVDTPEMLITEGFFDINDIAPNNNFWVNNEGLHYVYNQYEIAPYSMGPIEVTIPYEDIKSIIIPQSIVAKYID